MHNTEKRVFIYIIGILFLLCTVRIATIEKPDKPVHTESQSQKTSYTVKDFNGKIAVFENDSQKPSTVYETPLTSELPISDRKKLQQGIKVSSKKELITLLQDFDN